MNVKAGIRNLYRKAFRKIRQRSLDSNSRYWDARYESGGNSGLGSRGHLAAYKAAFMNRFVKDHRIATILEFGCGDGHQLALYDFPAYHGLDISPTAVSLCRQRFKDDRTKRFDKFVSRAGYCRAKKFSAQMTMSIDVIFHLVDEKIYSAYLTELFRAADRYVVVYASNCDVQPPAPHVRHRIFVNDVAREFPDWDLILVEKNPYPFYGDSATGSFADFHVFQRRKGEREAR